MPVTNPVPPPKIAYSKNNIVIELASDDYITAAGSKSVTTLVPTGFIAVSASVTLKWSKATVVMTATNLPDESGTTFINGNGDAAHMAAMVPYFQANYYIDRDFVVTSENTSLIFTARENGTAFNLNISSFYFLISYVPAVNLTIKPNFKHFLQVWLKVSGTFVNVYERLLELDYPYTGTTTKDLSEILHPNLVPGFANQFTSDKPYLTGFAWKKCTSTILPYYFKYAQSYGDKPAVKALKSSDQAFVNIGSLDIQTAAQTNLVDYIRPEPSDDSNTRCLRTGSEVKLVQINQPEHLYWVNLCETTVAIRVKFEVHLKVGGSVIFYSPAQLSDAYDKYSIPVGYLQCGIDAYLIAGSVCAYYTATIVDDADNPLSITYEYIIDDYREFARFFIYRNSLGGFQTLYTWGKGTVETIRSKDDINRQVTDREAFQNGRSQEINIKLQKKVTVFTGYTTERDIKTLKDFFASEEKYLIEENKFIPIGLTTDSLKEAQDGTNVNGASFEFYPRYDEVAFTDDPNDADNPNTAFVPTVHNIHFGDVATLPTSETDVLDDLTSAAFSSQIVFGTRSTHRIIVFALQTDKFIASVIDRDAVFNEDITLLFKNKGVITVNGIPKNIYALELGKPFTISHDLEFNII